MAGMLLMLLGSGGGPRVSLPDIISANQITISPTVATVTFSLLSTGLYTATGDLGGSWVEPQINMGDFEVRATLLSGSLSSGTLNTWQALSTSRAWSVSRSLLGSSTASISVEIRRIGETAILDTATVNFNATVES